MPGELNTVHAATNVYYIDSVTGNDANNGTSTATPWKSLSKVSSTTFQPGDQILFKAGSTWTGRLEPKGSGTEGAPIKIGAYGTGAKPLFQPDADWVDPAMTLNNYVKRNVTVNSVIKLYNQSYWEIEGLDLVDPNGANVNPDTTTVYRRAIYIEAQDVGAVKHIYIRNVHINGFKGPDTNEGKVSGGIVFHVQFNPDDPSLRQPTWFEDVVISDSTIENVSRSGIKFHSSWCTRAPGVGGKFPSVDFQGIGPWTPTVGVHIYNNVIHDVEGDGVIIRDIKDAIVEHNTVYRAAKGGSYAVGLFNWNSENVTFQYNEVYDTQPAGDAQGIEIDALNDKTYVQYNYVHNNAGGFAMWCNTANLPSYDGIYRYNISQNDSTSHGVIQPRATMRGSMLYNNTVYMGAGESRQFIYNFSGGPDNQVQVFNNIFYNQGTLSNLDFATGAINYNSNVYYGFPSTPSTDPNPITADPKLTSPGSGTVGLTTVAGYKLQADSPAINKGVFIPNNGGQDYWGASLYNGKPDIGANEYTGTAYPAASVIADGTYTLTVKHSGMKLEVNAGSLAEGAVIDQSADTGTDNQQWIITNIGNGYYKLINKKSGKAVAVDQASINNNAKIAQYTYTSNSPYNDEWQIVDVGGGYFQFINRYSSKAIDMPANSTTAGTQFAQWDAGTSNNQKFQLTPVSNAIVSGATYKMTVKSNGYALDVNANSTAEGAAIIQWNYGGGNNQQWVITDIGGGYYKIMNVNSGKALAVEGASTADNAKIVQVTYSSAAPSNDEWQLVDAGGGYYKLINRNSGKALDIPGSSTTLGTQFIQWTSGSADNQKVLLTKL
ncbi:hypothetical protein J2Z69_000994 [Paenibacillus shirakamiensis]|uniref:Ricin B lectin domain-containing protein n=1 Tax=Paenibacillus shirakamiensis TaxID=1265935 RepID=A0ABS4JFX8_9BACL|nr:hypothetical protein [Paenibacillus shirakamiensis]